MKMRINSIVGVLLWMTGIPVLNAQDLRFGYFQMNHTSLLNPAEVVHDREQVFLEYGRKWSKLASPPEVFQLGGIFHSTTNLSFGGIINRNSSGILDIYHFGINTGYKVSLAGNQSLSAGISTYIKSNSIVINNVVADLSDPILLGGQYNKTLFGLGLGLSYTYDNLKIHASLPETIGADGLEAFFTGGASYGVTVNDFQVSPSVTYYRSPVDEIFEGLAMVSWKNTLRGGVGYRTDDTFAFRFEFQSGPIALGYALASNIGDFSGVGSSNNFSVRYVFDRGKAQETSRRISSIAETNERILSRLDADKDSSRMAQKEILERLDAITNQQSTVQDLQRSFLSKYEEAERKNTIDESTNQEVEPGYYLVIYSFHDSTDLNKITEELVSLPFEYRLIHDKDKAFYYVSTKRYDTLEMSVIAMEKARSQGYEEAWIHWYK